MKDNGKMQDEKQKRHIQEMEAQLHAHFGDSMSLFLGDDLSLREKEKFLENIIFMEGVQEQPLFDYLERGGLPLPQPESLDDAQLHDKLWEVIHAMARAGQYLYNTNHLSDRQLYEDLWHRILREPSSISPEGSGAASHIDILGGCSEEDLQIRLKYYADAFDREEWAAEYPEDVLPEHEDPPYDRDRHLPGIPGFRVP